MDKSTSSQKGPEIFGSNWKFELRGILEEKINNPLLDEARYILPFGAVSENNTVKFKSLIKDLNNESNGPVDPLPWESNQKDTRTRIDGFREINRYSPMKIFVRRKNFDHTSIGIRQSFDATILQSTFVELKPKYKYLWDTNRKKVSITYFLGNFDMKRIEAQAMALLGECSEVYYMYSEEGKKIIKNMV